MAVGDHRNFLYDIGWQLMDLRQDIEVGHLFDSDGYPVDQIISRLLTLQQACGEYADRQLETGVDEWKVTPWM